MTHTAPHEHAPASEHDHDHDHAHGHGHDHAPEQAPATIDDLILDIGGDTGALIIAAAAARDQAEVEISPVGSRARSHNIVRRREAPSGAVYAAVFPAVTAGDYTVWHDARTAAGTVTIRGGQVASFRLDQP